MAKEIKDPNDLEIIENNAGQGSGTPAPEPQPRPDGPDDGDSL